MLKWRLKELLGEYQAKTGQPLHYKDVTSGTGLSANILSVMATNKTRVVNLDTMDKLLTYMSEKLERKVMACELIIMVDPSPAATTGKRKTKKGEVTE